MPELPEIETIKLQMEKELIGKTIGSMAVNKSKMWQGDKSEAEGKKIESIERQGKMIVWQLSGGAKTLFHLKMTGQLVFNSVENKYTHIIINFTDGTRLLFNDMRQFGWIKTANPKSKITSSKQIPNPKLQIKNLGPDALSEEFTLAYLQKILSNWHRPIKLLLCDQEKIAGIGNIYASEILFCSGIAPHHRGSELVKDHMDKVEQLYHCIKKVLQEALKYGGTSSSDEQYVNLYGEKGEMQKHLKVYQRENQPCPNNCGGTIKRLTLSGRSSFFCPKCQR